MKYLYLDTEVYTGNREVDLKQVGHAKNARDPLTEVMIVSYAIDNGSVKVWDVTENSTMPGDLRTALDDVINGCEAKIVMHNAPYDIAQMRFSLPDAVTIPLHKVKDTSVMARRLALPAALGELGQVLGIREDLQKLKEGKRLIQKFCKPRAVSKYNSATRWTRVNAKEDWAKFVEYAAFDIHAMREIFKTLTDVGRYNNEDDLWVLDQVINERGIPIDVESIQNAQALVERELERFNERIYRLTGGFVATAAQRDKLLHWLHSQRINAAGVTKQDIADLLSRNDLPDRVREVCEIRQQSSKTSTSKLKKMLQVVCNDGRVRGCLQYYGASRTGRWAGRLIQIQNFARGMFDEPEDMQTAIEVINSDLMDAMYDDKMEVISSCLRGMIAAKPGYKLIVADLSGIEARTLPWLACDEETLDVFRSGKDIYKSAAAGIYKKHYDDIDKGERFIGKVACIAEGQLVLTDKGLVPIERVTLDQKVWDGEQWVAHDGVVYKGEREVITYDGLTATAEHIVFTEDGREIPFGDAAVEQIKLRSSTPIRQSNRMGGDNITCYRVGGRKRQKRPPLQTKNADRKMYWMWRSKEDKHEKLATWKNERMSEMLTATKNPQVVRQKSYLYERTLRECERQELSQLRRERDRVQVFKCTGGRTLDKGESRVKERIADRQNRQRWALRARKLTMGNDEAAIVEQEMHKACKRMGVHRGGMALCQAHSRKKAAKWCESGRNRRGSEECCDRKAQKLEGNKGKARVYDLLNCGPNSRFTVSGVVVHNCLALGYAGGKNAFISMGKNYGVDIDDALAAKTVSDWRSANPKIVQLWSRVERMVKDAIRTGTIIKEGYFEAEVKKNFLYIRLPSGRLLCYYQMRIKGDRLVFKGVDQFTRKWADIDAYGGKIVENLTQAVARDVFAASFAKAEEAGYKIVAHVHDELIVEVPDDPDYSVERLSEIMCDNPSWTKGLPLEAKGVEGRRYSK